MTYRIERFTKQTEFIQLPSSHSVIATARLPGNPDLMKSSDDSHGDTGQIKVLFASRYEYNIYISDLNKEYELGSKMLPNFPT